MKNIMLLIITLSFSILSIAGTGRNIKWQFDKSWNPNSRYGKLYDPNSVEKVSGEIIEIEEFHPMTGMETGIHLILKTTGNTVPVHFGPAWYVLRQPMKFEVGDWITVKGSKILMSEKNMIVASQVKKNTEFLQLRDKSGTPYWCAGCTPRSEKF